MTQQGIYNEVEETQVRTEGDGFKRCLSDFMSDCAIAEMYRAIATTELAEVPIESLSETGNLDPEHWHLQWDKFLNTQPWDTLAQQ